MVKVKGTKSKVDVKAANKPSKRARYLKTLTLATAYSVGGRRMNMVHWQNGRQGEK